MSAGVVRAAQRTAQRALAGVSRVLAGQPTPDTHPELLKPGEIQPGIHADEFSERRRMLAGMLPSSGLAVLQAAPQVFVTGVIPYPYRQDADFQYFTGITQPGAVAVLQSNGRYILFYPDYNETEVKWNGARLSHDATLSFFGADEAYPMREMPSRLSTMLAAASTIVLEPESPNLAPLAATVSQLPGTVLAAQQGRVQPLRPLTHKLRWRKTPAELALMRRSAAAAASAMTQCMAHTRPGVSEHTIASLFEWRCKAAGAQRMAYPPVVAGGPDACTIHYSRNDKMLTAQDLLLLDGGCEMWGYASDVTRTWPVGGKFSSPQTAIYEAVLSAHRQLIEACRPGVTLRQLHHLSVRLLTDSLYGLGIAKGPNADAIVANGTFRKYYLHSVGHWLGMDTHDSSTMVHDRPLEPGVVLTIEPGLYIPDEEEYGSMRGIGVRLEDDVAVTAEGNEVLSSGVPIEPSDVEQLVGSAPSTSM